MATETIEYRGPQKTDRLGDPSGPVPEWSAVPGCKVWPRTSVETGTEVIIDGLGIKTPAKLPEGIEEISALGQIRARGKEWDVDGVPGWFPGKGYILYTKRIGS